MDAQDESTGSGRGPSTGVSDPNAHDGQIAGHEAFKAALNGEPLETSLDILIRSALAQIDDGARGAFYIANADRTELSHVVGMPDAYSRCVDGFKIGGDALACGLAVYTGKPVITPDVRKDPRWQDWLWLAEEFGYRAVWSFPVETSAGKVVGTFAVYHREPRDASAADRALAGAIAQAAAIIISWHEMAEERARAEAALREGEEKQAFLLKLADALRPLDDPADIRHTAVGILGQHLGANRVAYAEDGGDGHTFRVTPNYVDGALDVVGQHRYEDYGAALLSKLRAGRPSIQPDIQNDAELSDDEKQAHVPLGIQASLSVPLVKGGRLVAFLGVNYAAPHDFTDSEIELVEEVAERTWAAVERARAERAQKDIELRYRALFENVEAGFCIVEVDLQNADGRIDYRVVEANPAFYSQTGFPEAIFGRWLREAAPELEEDWYEAYGSVARTGRPARFEQRSELLKRSFEVRAFSAGDPADRLVAILFADITERKQAEETLREGGERQAFLLRLSDALRPLAEPREVQSKAAKLLGRHLSVSRVGYAEVDGAGEGAVAVVTSEWTSAPSASIVGRHPLQQFGEAFAAEMYAGRTIRADDMASHPMAGGAVAEAFAAIGIHAAITPTLVKAGRPSAVLFVHAAEPRHWTDAEVALVEDVAERTWAAVERARAETGLRESEERFRHIVESARDYAIFTTDADGVIDDWHEGAETVFGYTADDIVGQNGRILFTPEDRAAGEVEKELGTARAEGSAPNVRWHLRKDGARVFIEGRTIALKSANGGLLRGFLKIGQDVTERRRAEQSLFASEERFRQFAENSADVLWIADATLDPVRLEYVSPAFEAIWGVSRDTVISDISRFAQFVHPEDRERVAKALPTLLAGEAHQAQYRIRNQKDGSLRWILDTGFPVRDAAGKIIRIAGIAQDLTARKQAEDQVREARERLRALVEGIPQLVWRAREDGKWTWASRQWTDYTGLSDEASRGWGWLDAVHADDRERTRNAWSEAGARQRFDVEYRIHHAGENRYRWFQTRATPVREEGGSIAEWFGTSTDIDDLRRLQDEQKIILAELQHRSRNLLAVVRSTARKTLRPGEEVEEFGGRLAALSRVQGFLARSDGFAVELREIVRAEIEAHGDGTNVRIDGPAIELPGEKAQPFALALHELATNALKYGALSAESGRLDVVWGIETAEDGTRQLVLNWTESGVDLAQPGEAGRDPKRRGYGRELIERALPYQLGAKTQLEFTGDGVRCAIEVPLAVLMNRKG